ncbi:MAG: DoxX family protein [Bacteroidia bacterium]
MKYIVNIIRVLVGALFIFSGFVKAIDPLGTGYKMHEYFASFATIGMQSFWQWMNGLSTPISVIMIVLEMVAGIALLTGWANRFTVWLLFLMTLFFTVLTGFTYLSGYCPNSMFAVFSIVLVALFMVCAAKYHTANGKKIFAVTLLALLAFVVLLKFTNLLLTCDFDKTKMKVTDCGCFGDFLHLEPHTTFWKDIILDILIFILVIGVDYIKPLFKAFATNAVTVAATVASLWFCFSNYLWGLPIVDFRPYKIGNNIRELRTVQKDPVIEYVFIYKNKKTGEQKEFGMNELGNLNDDWEFDTKAGDGGRKDKIIDPGIPAKIDGFYINDEHGDITDSLLSDKNYSLMVVAYHLSETEKDAFTEKLNPLEAQCEKAGISFYCVTGGDIPSDPFRHDMQTAYPFYTSDETPLKTIIRSNPGLVLLKNGVVINMWHHRHIPEFAELNEMYFSKK